MLEWKLRDNMIVANKTCLWEQNNTWAGCEISSSQGYKKYYKKTGIYFVAILNGALERFRLWKVAQ